jgi:PhnB protein
MTERPDRYRNAVVPHIYVDGASKAIAFYKRAFGAVELFRIAHPDGKILHAEISICGSVIMIGDPDNRLYGEPRKLGACTAGLHIFVDDNAALLRRAVEAGAEEIQKPTEMFYGANSASTRDPFGHVWVLLSWKQDLAPAEMESRGNALLARQASGSSERESSHPIGQSQAEPRTRARANTRIYGSEL